MGGGKPGRGTERHSPMTVNCAHRGASAEAPENTFAAFALAIEQGARMIELDVRLSRDGVPVVIHDATLTRTTNGQGEVETLPASTLLSADAGAWFDARFRGERIPRLADVISFVRTHGVQLDIEMKLGDGPYHGLCEAVAAVLSETAFHDGCFVSSFHHEALDGLARLDPRVAIARLYARDVPTDTQLAEVPSVAVQHLLVDAALVDRVHAGGGRIHVWTVDDPADMRRMRDMGVDTIMSNRPRVLQEVLDEPRGETRASEGDGSPDHK